MSEGQDLSSVSMSVDFPDSPEVNFSFTTEATPAGVVGNSDNQASELPERAHVLRDEKVIRGVSVVTRGEALGHNFWVDMVFLSQVANAINSRQNGIPMRWAHPNLCNDGMGKQVGRLKNARLDVVSGKVIGDVYFYKKASGERAEYIESLLDLAEEDPEVLGLSIVFEVDEDETNHFIETHMVDGKFVSPDKDNQHNYYHIRLSKLFYVDFVNEPAANPSGLFASSYFTSGNKIIDSSIRYILGIDNNADWNCRVNFVRTTGVDIDSVRRAFSDFIVREGIVVARASDIAALRVAFGAISYNSAHPNGTPLAPEDEPWDGPGEVQKADVDDLWVMCTWVDDEKSDTKGAFKLPHHKAGGEHAVVWRGVANAAARLPQTQVPSGDVPGIKAHLARHYREFGKEPPWSRLPDAWEKYCDLVRKYMQGGIELNDDDIQHLLRKCGLDVEARALSGESANVELDLSVDKSREIVDTLKSIIDNSEKLFRVQLFGRS